MISYRVDIYALENRKERPKPYGVRWRVERSYKRRSFKTRAQAENFRSDLMQAAKKGEGFDSETGLPESMTEAEPSLTTYDLALTYSRMKWSGAAAKTRRTTAQALATVLPVLVRPGAANPPASDVLRNGLINWALNPPRRETPQPVEVAAALAWLEKNAVPLNAFNDVTQRPTLIRAALDACAPRQDGKPSAASTRRNRRSVLHNYFGHAVEKGYVTVNPVGTVQWKVTKVADAVDRRVVLSPAQFSQFLVALSYVGRYEGRGAKLSAFFGLMYYAGARPAEALAVVKDDFTLPKKGWGMVTLARSEPEAGTAWTDDGARNEQRGLKWRACKEVRAVPIPPALVRLIQAHLKRWGTGPGGRLFRTATGGRYSQTAYNQTWDAVRPIALQPHQVKSTLGLRPYDLRHAAVTLWLNSGVPIPEVARRAGHSSDVLLKVYAGCIDSGSSAANARIDEALGDDAA